MKKFIQYVINNAQSRAKTRSGINYLVMPRDFHPQAMQIPYFAIADPASNIYAVSEDVPPGFRSFWVEHEKACAASGYTKCDELTDKEMYKIRLLFLTKEYELYLKLRAAMFEAVVLTQAENPRCKHWKASLERLSRELENSKPGIRVVNGVRV
ncbi:hypothetical protein IPM19_00285 [bacterium]|nr:MAG: hypothetical protein IPM19_00285 [bacterium]